MGLGAAVPQICAVLPPQRKNRTNTTFTTGNSNICSCPQNYLPLSKKFPCRPFLTPKIVASYMLVFN